jgi:hypothetical protein
MRLAPQDRQEVPIPTVDGQPNYATISNAAALTFDFVDNNQGEVRAVALDSLELTEIALIKIDTQGADLRVLEGADATIRRCRPVILFEWERDLGQQHGATLDDFRTFFASRDYSMEILHEITEGRQADFIARPC